MSKQRSRGGAEPKESKEARGARERGINVGGKGCQKGDRSRERKRQCGKTPRATAGEKSQTHEDGRRQVRVPEARRRGEESQKTPGT